MFDESYQYQQLLDEVIAIRSDLHFLSKQIAEAEARQIRLLELLLARAQINVEQHSSGVSVSGNATVDSRDIAGGGVAKRDENA